MNAPVIDPYTPLIAAYYDGELADKRRAEVQAHLAHCQECQAELQALRSLSSLLQADWLITGEGAATQEVSAGQSVRDQALSDQALSNQALSNQAFAGEVLRRLPQPSNGLTRGLKVAWQLAPLGLFVAWAFVQAATWAGGLILLAGAAPGRPDPRWLELFGALAGPDSTTTLSLSMLIAANLWLTLNLALLFGGWLASWIAYQRRRAVFA